MEFLFILRYLSFLSVSVKQCEKIMRSVDRGVAHSTYYVTQIAFCAPLIILRQIDFDIFQVFRYNTAALPC